MGGGPDLQCCYREQIAFNMYSKFCEPKLYRLAAKGDWDLIPARCRSSHGAKEAKFRHKYAPNDTCLHRILRLSEGMNHHTFMETTTTTTTTNNSTNLYDGMSSSTSLQIREMKLNAIQALLEARPEAATTPDAFGRTPLHLACMDLCTQSGTAVLKTLIRHASGCDRAAKMTDVEKRTPLHYLVARNDSIPIEALHVLMDACPTAVEVKDIVKETPVDIAIRRAESKELENVEQVLAVLGA